MSTLHTADRARLVRSEKLRRVRLPWLLLTAAVWMIAAACAVFFWGYLNQGVHGMDSGAYWLTAHRHDLYGAAPGSVDAYLYSPAFAALLWPVAQLPRHLFIDVWMLAEAVAFGWLLRPLRLRWGVPAFCLCMGEIVVGNIYSFLAVVAVVGARQPAAWALPLLTKITPGLGPVWFAVRREWRALAWSGAVTAGIAVVSFAVNPAGWFDWIRFLVDNAGGSQFLLPLRVAVAAALVAYAAVRRWTWVLPIAMLLANPMVLHSEMALSLLAALPRLIRDATWDRRDRTAPMRSSDTIGA